jgi:hypothetical protein
MSRATRRLRCKDCQALRSVVGEFSATGLCRGCGERRREENILQLIAHDGPHFEHWRRRSLAALGVAALDATGDGA